MYGWLTDRTQVHVQRWHHRALPEKESLAEHQFAVARIAYWLAMLVNEEDRGSVDATQVAMLALFHDDAELVTGDIPHPTKDLIGADVIARMEHAANEQLIALAPPPFRVPMHLLLNPMPSEILEHEIIRYADDLSALAYLRDQIDAGYKAAHVLDLHDSVLAQVRGRDWPWLQQLREKYSDLP